MAKEFRNIVVNRLFETALSKYSRIYLSGRLIDIGCGTKPYRDMLSPFVSEHIGVDRANTLHEMTSIDVFASAYDIQAEAVYFDSSDMYGCLGTLGGA